MTVNFHHAPEAPTAGIVPSMLSSSYRTPEVAASLSSLPTYSWLRLDGGVVAYANGQPEQRAAVWDTRGRLLATATQQMSLVSVPKGFSRPGVAGVDEQGT
jgi:hypothetical protein